MLKLQTLKVSADVDGKCVFACRICSEHFWSQGSFELHRRLKNHYLTPPQPAISHLVSGFSYKCDICSSLMLCERKVIRNHMNKKHHITLSKPKLTGMKLKYRELCDDFVKGLSESAKIHEKTEVPVEQVPLQEITPAIGNLCNFLCPFCDTISYCSWYLLSKHVKSIHRKKIVYSSSIVNTARYHSCLICPKAILSDRQFLQTHLNKKHKMCLSKYEETIIKHGGKVLPTYQNWLKSKSFPVMPANYLQSLTEQDFFTDLRGSPEK